MRKNLLALVFILNITNLFSQATDRIYLNNGKYEDIINVKYIKNFVSFSRLDSTSGFYDMKDVSRVKKIVTEINQFEFKDKAKEYITAQQLIYSDQKNATTHFNAGIDACIKCHENKCGGPVPRIKKLYIE